MNNKIEKKNQFTKRPNKIKRIKTKLIYISQIKIIRLSDKIKNKLNFTKKTRKKIKIKIIKIKVEISITNMTTLKFNNIYIY